jgi:hypothetical protein
MGTGSLQGVESGRGVTLTPHPLLVPRSKKQSRAISLLSLRAFVACKKGETYLLTVIELSLGGSRDKTSKKTYTKTKQYKNTQ